MVDALLAWTYNEAVVEDGVLNQVSTTVYPSRFKSRWLTYISRLLHPFIDKLTWMILVVRSGTNCEIDS